MIKVMIVDDEPYIRQGLRILIDWEKYGYCICEEAANGQEAVNILEDTDIDLVITDIKMPKMDGLDLIKYTREHISKKIKFIILSGFYEFEYAKLAIKYDVADYVLKPVQRDELIKVLEEYKEIYYHQIENYKKQEISNKIIFDRHLASLVSGIKNSDSINYIKRHLFSIENVRYIGIEYDTSIDKHANKSNEEKSKEQQQLYEAMKTYLGDHWYHVYIPHSNNNEFYLGFIYTRALAEEENLREKEYIKNLHDSLSHILCNKIIIYIGQMVSDIEQISESYKSALIAKNFQLYSRKMNIAFYDEIKNKISNNKFSVDKEVIDQLIKAIEINDTGLIEKNVDNLYEHFKDLVADPEMIKISIDYLVFSLISLAKELYLDFNQDEVSNIISQSGYDQIAVRGSVSHFKKFALEFSDYLNSLRRHTFGGVLVDIEKEIIDNYMDNLSLKYLSEKYYINSAYLGQIFKKQFGITFKDYLNNYRIDKACEMLLRADDKIYEIAEAVGFNNTDYFISKFVQLKGTTPLQYRLQSIKR
ncbi:MAG: response regulator [Clostridiales bacterium]|nr:response regulator [Clostridiales bacterium]